MAIRHGALPEDFKQLLDIIQRGQLFALQDSLKAGKCPRVTERNKFIALPLPRLQFRWQRFDLLGGKDGSFFAYIHRPGIATATFAQTAFHAVFQRGKNIPALKAEFLQALQRELDHDGRTAKHRDAIG